MFDLGPSQDQKIFILANAVAQLTPEQQKIIVGSSATHLNVVDPGEEYTASQNRLFYSLMKLGLVEKRYSDSNGESWWMLTEMGIQANSYLRARAHASEATNV